MGKAGLLPVVLAGVVFSCGCIAKAPAQFDWHLMVPLGVIEVKLYIGFVPVDFL